MNFNPRIPYGMRPAVVPAFYPKEPHFNPRIPYGMRHLEFLTNELAKLFQSTHPLRDATVLIILSLLLFLFQSTHPLRDATIYSTQRSSSCCYFNPRIPYGMRQIFRPLGSWIVRFQSTHPLRDATARKNAENCVDAISIHASLTGCDLTARRSYRFIQISIHASLTGCDIEALINYLSDSISIHASLTGCDTAVPAFERLNAISIHASLTGCDCRKWKQRTCRHYFNPRIPYGMRPAAWDIPVQG